jgi:hypothetical protein
VLHGEGTRPPLDATVGRAHGQRICHRRLPARRLAERVVSPYPNVLGRDTPQDTLAVRNTAGGLRDISEHSTLFVWEGSNWRRQSPGARVRISMRVINSSWIHR